MIRVNDNNVDTMFDEIKAIKARNERVERDKAWETSWSTIILFKAIQFDIITL